MKTFFSSCDPIPPSALEVVNRGRTEEEKMEILVGITRQAFPKCKDILKDGMTTDELNLAVACISLILRHDTAQEHENGKNVHCYCALSSHSPDAKRLKKSESNTVSSVRCPFHLHFTKFNDRWYLDSSARNSASRNCSLRLFPDICSSKPFLQFIVTEWMKHTGIAMKQLKPSAVRTWLKDKGLQSSHFRTINRVVNTILDRSVKGTLELEQKIEDYVHCLNSFGQYGVLLYNTGELIVPKSEGIGNAVKRCRLVGTPIFCFPFAGCSRNFWDDLPNVDVDERSDKESVLYTFEAVANAVRAFGFSIPVISLDACFVKCTGTTAVLMSASFMTTEGHIMPMCHGTAPKETISSWCFFLVNLRQVLEKYCPEIDDWSKIAFMSDRHQGLLSGVAWHFPGSHHLYCATHILRNITTKGIDEHYFWLAVEATCQQDFEDACIKVSAPKLIPLMKDASHWSRFRIRECGCKRFGIRTSNLSESLNNAFSDVRSGPLLHVLLNAFRYATIKYSEYRSVAANYKGCCGDMGKFTSFAQNIYSSNGEMAAKCTIETESLTEWIVRDCKRYFRVIIAEDNSKMSCSCQRYFDEEIACPHILKVLDHTRKLFPLDALISPLYLKERFRLAFPQGQTFWPKDSDLYSINPRVVPSEAKQKAGAPRFRRFASVGENPHSRRVSRPPSIQQQVLEEDSLPDVKAIADVMQSEELRKIALDRALASGRVDNDECFSLVKEFLQSKQLEAETQSQSSASDDSDDEMEDSDDGKDSFYVSDSLPNDDDDVQYENDDNESHHSSAAVLANLAVVQQTHIDENQSASAELMPPQIVDLSSIRRVVKSKFVARGPTFLWHKTPRRHPRHKKRIRTRTTNKTTKEVSLVQRPVEAASSSTSDQRQVDSSEVGSARQKRLVQRSEVASISCSKDNEGSSTDRKMIKIRSMVPTRTYRYIEQLCQQNDDIYLL